MMKVGKTIFQVIIFSVAMGYLEAAVVVYLRDIYYPKGFTFPLKLLNKRDLMVEVGRELATLIMLISIGVIAGKTKIQRFAYFLLAFGFWDITYYVFLWLILRWPATILTWDILFLLPLVWVGPVLAPCILSLTMIVCAIVILQSPNAAKVELTLPVLLCLIAGSLIVIVSFTEDPVRHLSNLVGGKTGYRPAQFLWRLFILGEGIIIAGIYMMYRMGRNENRSNNFAGLKNDHEKN